jgi:hypothetical protein
MGTKINIVSKIGAKKWHQDPYCNQTNHHGVPVHYSLMPRMAKYIKVRELNCRLNKIPLTLGLLLKYTNE